jgi:cytoskeletal protein CcmA (bactofilin family)
MRRRNSGVTGFLDQETSVVGELRVTGNLRLDGEFHGQIVVEGSLFVGATAEIHADIQAHAADIHGRITGTVIARDRLDLRKSGRILGDIESPVLVIEDGGILVGQSRMGGEAPPSSSGTPIGLARRGEESAQPSTGM